MRSAWNWLTWGATALALLLCFRGQTQHVWAILVALLPWACRLSLSATFRQELAGLIGSLWQTCLDYPHRDNSTPWRAAALLVVIPAAVFFLANTHIDEGDNVPIMLAASSLVAEGNWELSEYLDRPGEYPYLGILGETSRGTYSTYPAGPVQFAAPVVLICRLVGGSVQQFTVQRRLHKWTAAWLSATCLGLFFLTALHLVDAGPAWVITLLLATGSAMYTTIGQGLWQHGGILFWSQLFVFLEFRRLIRPARAILCLQGMSLGFMLACRLSAALILVPFVVWVFVREWRRGLALALLGAIFYLPWACLYLSIYGQPFGPSIGQCDSFAWDRQRILAALSGMLFSPGRGFFVYQVWAILAVGALLEMINRLGRAPRHGSWPAGWQWLCISTFVLNVAMVSAWGRWWGGWCWGSRLLSDSLLLFALLCVRPAAHLWQHLSGRRLIVAMAVVGFVLNMPVIYLGAKRWNAVPGDIDDQPQRLWSWQQAPFFYPLHPGVRSTAHASASSAH